MLGALWAVTRPHPASPRLRLEPALPAESALPGEPPSLPWPPAGQAAIAIAGIGSLGARDGDTPVPIASVTKVMTALVVLQTIRCSPGEEGPAITMTAADVGAYEAGVRVGRSELRVAVGETLTEHQALEALLVGSANNVADALARWDAGSVPGFVDRMNARAVAEGLAHTHYADPSGVDAGNVSTALDQLQLAELVLRAPTLAAIVATPQVTLPVAGTVSNYNSLVGRDGVVGVKTGSTDAAGGCWVFAAQRPIAGGTRLVVGVVLGQRGPDLLQAAFAAGRRLLDGASESAVTATVLAAGSPVGQVAGPGGLRVPAISGSRSKRRCAFAEQDGCVVEVRHSGHTWGHVVAPNGQRFRVWSTPKEADMAARMIRRFVLSNREG